MRLATSWWQRRSALHELTGHSRKLHRLARAKRREARAVESNFRQVDLRPSGEDRPGLDDFAPGIVSTDWETYRREGPGMSTFTLEDGVVYHNYSAYERGLDGLWGI